MVTLMATNGNKAMTTARIEEVSVADIPPGQQSHKSKYSSLFDELVMRLEQTSKRHALSVAFESERAAKLARVGLTHLCKVRLGKEVITFKPRKDGDIWKVYALHGPNWK